MRGYADRTINGLVGIYLPEHRRKHFRLTDNINSGYAIRMNWSEYEDEFIDTVHTAWNRRNRDDLIDNSRPLRINNAPLEKKNYPSRPFLKKKKGFWEQLFFGE